MNIDIAEIAERQLRLALERVEKVKRRLAVVNALEEAGLKMDTYDAGAAVRYGCPLAITVQDLPVIRKVTGRLKVTGKSVADDFKNEEIRIELTPMAKDFDCVNFTYKKKFRNGGKCHIERTSYENISLVCRV